MKILFLTHTFPYPLNEGVRLHLYHLLKELSKTNEVFLIAMNDCEISENSLTEVLSLGVKIVKAFKHQLPQNFLARLKNCLFEQDPFFVKQFWSSQLKKTIQDFLEKNKVDVVHVEYLSMAPYATLFKNVPKIFCPLDAVSMMYERNIAGESNVLRKLYTINQQKKIKNFESRWIPFFDATMLVSPVDKQYLQNHCPGAKIEVSAIGVDVEYFKPLPIAEQDYTIVFRGMMNFLPNSDAVRYFYQDIFPLVRKVLPQTKFIVVGKDVPQDIAQIAAQDSNVICTGYVDDIRESMAKASVIVSPMRIGSGMKIKVLEALAMAKAVVATSMSCAGLNAENGKEIFIEDNPQQFAARVVELLQNPSLRQTIGVQAQIFSRNNYTWKKSALEFEALYKQAIAKYAK